MNENSVAEHNLTELGSAAAGIAHDINNQLTLILNYLDISNLEGARAAAGRCSTLTGSLLSWCRGEALHPMELNVCAFLVDFADNIHLSDGVTLRIDISEMPIEIDADPLALTRMLTNLVNNASDAMDGMGSVVIHAFGHTIEVTDSGPGISTANAKRIFEPFFSTKGSKGTGLGLAIVRELMHRHGGSAILRNEPNGGATFSLVFRQSTRGPWTCPLN